MFVRTALSLMFLTIAALGLAPCAHAQRGNPAMHWRGESIDAMIARFMVENGIPGLSLAIVQAPYIPRAVGYGLADTRTRLLVGTNTVFDVGQMAHAYAGVAAMQLVEAGKLGLDDPAGKYLPDVPEAWRAVPVRALLAHASGIPDNGEPAKPLAFAPGSRVAQSAMDTQLLARVVEAASGEPYRDFVRKNQFERLGLARTFFSEEAATRMRGEDVAGNNNRHKDFLTDPRLINPTERATGYVGEASAQTTPGAPNAILASAMDISIWDVGLAGSILVKDPALRAVLYAPLRLTDGNAVPVMGAWRFPGRKGLMYVTGSGSGQSAFLSRFTDPSELVCVTLLANREGVDFTQLARRIAGAYDPRLGPPAAPGMRVQQSPYPAGETLARFEAALRSQGYNVQSRADVSAGKEKARPGTGWSGESGTETTRPGTASSQRHDRPLRFAFTSPDSPQRGKPLQAVAWEEDGQVWLGCTDPAAQDAKTPHFGRGEQRARKGEQGMSRMDEAKGAAGDGSSAGSIGQDDKRLALRRALDRTLLQAVTPY